MQRHGGGIRQADAGDDRVDVLLLERAEQRGVERRAAPTSHRVGTTVDAGLDRRAIGRFGTPPAAARISHTATPAVGRHEQPMSTRRAVLVEPRPPLGRGERLEVERDRGVDDVMVVNLGQRLEVVERGRPDRVVRHPRILRRVL